MLASVLLAADLAITLAVLGAVALIDAVASAGPTSADLELLLALGDLRNPTTTALLRVVSLAGSPVVVVVVVAVAASLLARRRRLDLAALVIASSAGAAVISTTLKATVGRARPGVDALVEASGHAFPSGHATQAVACYGAVAVAVAVAVLLGRRRVVLAAVAGVAAVVIAAAVGLSRVYLGVHWPSDVITGWRIASAWLMTVTVALGVAHHGLTGDGAHDRPRTTGDEDPGHRRR